MIWRCALPLSKLSSPIVHADCSCNEIVCIRNRVIGEVPLPTRTALLSLRRTLKRMSGHLSPVAPITYEEFYSSYSGGKRKAYINAALNLEERGVSARDAEISMFVKCERINPIAKDNPDPRPISARTKEYVLSVGIWLKPLEHQVYHSKFGLPSRVIAKGLNPYKRASLLMKKWSRFSNPLAISLDCSRWDKHVSLELLRCEHEFYYRKCRDPTLKWLLSLQLVNKCKSRCGTRYISRGRRMSGDYNTALGNCLLMTAMVFNVFDSVGIKYDVMDDGDDCLVIIEEEDFCKIKYIDKAFLDFGHEVKVENKATRPEHVVFCQSSPIFDGEEWKFVRNPYKVLSNASTGFLKMRDVKLRRKMFYAVGVCELALNVGVPVIQNFACKLISLGTPCDVVEQLRYDPNFQDLAYRVRGMDLSSRYRIPNCTTRLSFAEAFGITTAEQSDMETIIDYWDPDIFDEYEVPYDFCRDLRVAMDVSLTGY